MLYSMYKRGFLPNAGAVADQSNALLSAFRILDEANYEADKAEEEKAKKQSARSQRSAHGKGRRR